MLAQGFPLRRAGGDPQAGVFGQPRDHVVTDAKIEPTQRNPGEFCLYKLNGSCGICIKKCALKALKADSRDKQACYKECLRNAKKYAELGLADVCGKCFADAPCSFMNPSKKPERKA